ncbi:MAG: hypothetical protein ACRC4T_27635 [Cetobacterium sp.]
MNKRVLFLITERAYLPELSAYKEYFKKKGYKVDIKNEKDKIKEEYDIVWKFIGRDLGIRLNKKYFLIHDYKSDSTGSFLKIKNFIKKYFTKKPNLRIFLNQDLKNKFNFKDNVSSTIIDMGVHRNFLEKNKSNNEIKYKFVYCGSISYIREVDKILDWFLKQNLFQEKFLLIGEPQKEIFEKYKSYENIVFKGRIDYLKIPLLLDQCEYAFNHIPNMSPYKDQTPTKFLEYSAKNLKIVSSRTPWIEKFISQNNCKTYLYSNIDELTLKSIEEFSYKNISMIDYEWDKIIEKSNIDMYLAKEFENEKK